MSNKNDWIKIKNYYIHHAISLEELAKKFKVSQSAVNAHCRLEKWVEKKEKKQYEIDKKVAEKTQQAVIDRKVAANERHNSLYNKGLDVAEALLNLYFGENTNKTKATAYSLKAILEAIRLAQQGQRTALGLDDKEVVETEPELKIISGVDENKI